MSEIALEEQWATPPCYAFPDVTWAALRAELERELAARRSLYPELERKGRKTPEQAAHGIGVFAAMLADLARLSPPWPAPRAWDPPGHAFTWADRRNALRDELALRGRLYPQWIAEGRLEEALGRHRIRCLEALEWIYDDGFDWRASNGARPALAKINDRTKAEDRALREWLAHMATIEAMRHPPQQEELEL
jgi:hypothetical protein